MPLPGIEPQSSSLQSDTILTELPRVNLIFSPSVKTYTFSRRIRLTAYTVLEPGSSVCIASGYGLDDRAIL
jgi:hypothetical protein